MNRDSQPYPAFVRFPVINSQKHVRQAMVMYQLTSLASMNFHQLCCTPPISCRCHFLFFEPVSEGLHKSEQFLIEKLH